MVLVASSVQTARIRHGDKGSLCRRMSNALTDESETLLSLFLSVFSFSFSLYRSLLSLSIYSPPHSVSPPHSYLYLSEAVSPSFPSPLRLSLVIPLLLFLAVRCSFALHFSLSLYFLSPFTPVQLLPISNHVYSSLSKFKFVLLAWT